MNPLNEKQRSQLEKVWAQELEFLASLQLANGALPMTGAPETKLNMNPYFADFTALALLDAGRTYEETVRAYIGWHFAHLNTAEEDVNGVDGTIYDYVISVSGGKIQEQIALDEKGIKHYDSTDSYGATFLSVLKKYAEKTGDAALLRPRYEAVTRIASAMTATMQANGLTFAKPDYPVEYLMDNCEVIQGSEDYAWLLEHVYADRAEAAGQAEKARRTADLIRCSIERDMWNEEGSFYETTVDEQGRPAWHFDWNEFYPSATAQLFPLIFGILDPKTSRAQKLYAGFNAAFGTGEEQKNWRRLSTPSPFVWGDIAQAAARMGDTEAVAEYMAAYEKAAGAEHAYPIYNADSAKAAMACFDLLHQN